MAAAPVGGFLLPLDGNKEAKSSIPKIALSQGTAFLLPISISVGNIFQFLPLLMALLIFSSKGRTPLSYNPKVKEISFCPVKIEKWKIQTGDIIELIPGHYLFKYVAANNTTDGRIPAANREKRPSGEESSKGKQLAHSRKRMHRTPEEEAFTQNSNDVLQCSNQLPNTSSEGIRNFRISKNMLPSTFRLVQAKELPEWANTNAVSINDVILV